MRRRAGRPRLKRNICFDPAVCYFKPQGVGVSELEVVEIRTDEMEAIRLKNIEDLDQRDCAKKMGTSPATFQRILASANQKIALALTEGKAIKIIKD
jgi:predicted DNA-binding protein (UPF0251 family)